MAYAHGKLPVTVHRPSDIIGNEASELDLTVFSSRPISLRSPLASCLRRNRAGGLLVAKLYAVVVIVVVVVVIVGKLAY